MATPGYVQALIEATAYFERFAEKNHDQFYTITSDCETFSEGLLYTSYYDSSKTKVKNKLLLNLEVWDVEDFDIKEIK
jgi:hypothetical protein